MRALLLGAAGEANLALCADWIKAYLLGAPAATVGAPLRAAWRAYWADSLILLVGVAGEPARLTVTALPGAARMLAERLGTV